MNDVKVDRRNCDVRAIHFLVPESLKYSIFCDIFVPKSQKVLAELTAKKPKNLQGNLAYT